MSASIDPGACPAFLMVRLEIDLARRIDFVGDSSFPGCSTTLVGVSSCFLGFTYFLTDFLLTLVESIGVIYGSGVGGKMLIWLLSIMPEFLVRTVLSLSCLDASSWGGGSRVGGWFVSKMFLYSYPLHDLRLKVLI